MSARGAPAESGASNWHHSVAGGVAGSASVLFLHPVDVIKTRLQVQDGHQKQLVYRNTWDAIKGTFQKEGWRAFYNGLVPAWVGSGVAWSTYLTIYESIKGFHLNRQGVERLSPHWHTISAAEAGAIVCVLTNPIWLIKTRMQLQQRLPPATTAASLSHGAASTLQRSATSAFQGTAASTPAAAVLHQKAGWPHSSNAGSAVGSAQGASAGAQQHSVAAHKQYRGFLDALWKIGREEGLKGYYKGLGPSLVLQTTHGAAQFTVYEELKHMALRSGRQKNEPDRQITSAETTVFAAASKLAASIITYPSQVVRSRLQQRKEYRELEYNSSWQVVRLTWRNEGLRGFYKGLGPALLRVMPQSAVTLVVYENLLSFLKTHSR